MGPTTSVDHFLPGRCFHLDFGFMHASSQTFIKIIGATQVVNSCHGYNSDVIIHDANTRYTWVFLTETKKQPTLLVNTSFNINGLKLVTVLFALTEVINSGPLTLHHVTATAG
jgi:hypothetical protein